MAATAVETKRSSWVPLAVAGALVAMAAFWFGRLVQALHRLWDDLPDGGTGPAQAVVITSGAIAIVAGLLWLGLARWQRWRWPVTWASTAIVVMIGSFAGLLVAFGANLNSR